MNARVASADDMLSQAGSHRYSLVDRLTWPFAPVARARRSLWLARRFSGDRKRITAVDAALRKLQQHIAASVHQELIVEMLLFVGSKALEAGSLAETERCLLELDAIPSTFRSRLRLRVRLMHVLLERKVEQAFLEHASVLLGDPKTSWSTHGPLVLWVLRALYERSSPAACALALGAANDELNCEPHVLAVRTLCEACDGFKSAEAARTWAKGLTVHRLAFSTRMFVDALLGRARAAEWQRDWTSMSRHVREARTLLPDLDEVGYWTTRAALHFPGVRVEEPRAPTDPSLHWQRLRALIDLHRDPSLDHAEAAIAVLCGRSGQPDPPERELAIDLIRRSLPQSGILDEDQIARSAEVAARVKAEVTDADWADIFIARREICLERDYRTAVERLEQEQVRREPGAENLVRVSRLLLGEPEIGSPIVPFKNVGDAMEMMEWVFRALCLPARKELAAMAATDWTKLDEARQEKVFQQHPGLQFAFEVLILWLRLRAEGTAAVRQAALALEPSPTLPVWARWLIGRACLLACEPDRADSYLAMVSADETACAWDLESWAYDHSFPSTRLQDLRGTAATILDRAAAADQPHSAIQARSALVELREMRDSRYRVRAPKRKSLKGAGRTANLGSAWSAVWAADLEVERDYADARFILARGYSKGALELLTKVERRLVDLSAISETWWMPVIQYWKGVACAHLGTDEAGPLLEGLLGGPREHQARGQLALLALREGRVRAAEEWLDGSSEIIPAVRYARALVYAREGDDEGTRAVLESLVECNSPYALASRRLLAALDERAGRCAVAERRHREILQVAADDPVTAARLGRLLVRRMYEEPVDAGDHEPVTALLASASQSVRWARDYLDLYRALVGSVSDLQEVETSTSGSAEVRGPVAARLLARRYLELGEAARAKAVLDGAGGNEAEDLGARWILATWETLASAWHPTPDDRVVADFEIKQDADVRGKPGDDCPEGLDELRESLGSRRTSQLRRPIRHFLTNVAKSAREFDPAGVRFRLRQRRRLKSDRLLAEALARCRARLEASASVEGDAEVARWRSFLDFGLQVVPGADGGTGASGNSALPEGPEPFWKVVRLWDEDEPRRRAAADLASAGSSFPPGWSDLVSATVLALASWIRGDEDGYLSQYSRLAPHLDELPVDGRALWLAAARVWFRRGQWTRLTEGELPACVEDLSHPEVRLIVGLAYARLAADTSDSRAAERLVRQARDMLSDLGSASQD